MFLKTYDIECDELFIKFTNQSGRPLEIEDKIFVIMGMYILL